LFVTDVIAREFGTRCRGVPSVLDMALKPRLV